MIKELFVGFYVGAFSFNAIAQQHNFDDILQCHNSADAPGMAVRIERSGKQIYGGVIGISNTETKRALRVDDIFQIGSVTKTFTAAAILKLSEENKLSLQDTLGQFIPNLNPEYKHLTIRRVLSHTSGLPDYLGDASVTKIYDRFAPVDKVIGAISKQPLLFKPSEKYSYSNLGYILLGKVIEVVSTASYDQYMHQTFFKPLKMEDTFVITKGTQVGKVNGYTTNRDAPKKYLNAEESNERAWNVDRSWIYSAGAIASTLADMSLWNKALISGQVISKESFRLMTTQAVLGNKSTVNYGLGLDIYPISGQTSFSHQGMVPGFFSWNVYFPNQDLTATAFSNLDTKHPGPALLDMIARQLNLSPEPINDTTKLNRLVKRLVGNYRNSDSKILKITFESQQLFAQLEGGKKRKLVPRENGSFSYECTEDYFALRENNKKVELIPISIFHGEQSPLVKL